MKGTCRICELVIGLCRRQATRSRISTIPAHVKRTLPVSRPQWILGLAILFIDNPYLGTELDKAKTEDLKKGIPALSIQQIIDCSQSLGSFAFEVDEDRGTEVGHRQGVVFKGEGDLQKAVGPYVHIDQVSLVKFPYIQPIRVLSCVSHQTKTHL